MLCSDTPGRCAQPEVCCELLSPRRKEALPDLALYHRVLITPTRGRNV